MTCRFCNNEHEGLHCERGATVNIEAMFNRLQELEDDRRYKDETILRLSRERDELKSLLINYMRAAVAITNQAMADGWHGKMPDEFAWIKELATKAMALLVPTGGLR